MHFSSDRARRAAAKLPLPATTAADWPKKTTIAQQQHKQMQMNIYNSKPHLRKNKRTSKAHTNENTKELQKCKRWLSQQMNTEETQPTAKDNV